VNGDVVGGLLQLAVSRSAFRFTLPGRQHSQTVAENRDIARRKPGIALSLMPTVQFTVMQTLHSNRGSTIVAKVLRAARKIDKERL
jgi:hypothetical protein